jgi:glutamyl-tRNA synthetase
VLLVGEFVERPRPHFTHGETAQVLAPIAPLVQERVRLLTEVEPMVAFLLDRPLDIDDASWQKEVVKPDHAGTVLQRAADGFAAIETWDAAAVEAVVGDLAVALGFVDDEGRPRIGKVQGPIRVATTGRRVGPPLWESLEVLGRDRTVARLRAAMERM